MFYILIVGDHSLMVERMRVFVEELSLIIENLWWRIEHLTPYPFYSYIPEKYL